jgi:hypothetical protein
MDCARRARAKSARVPEARSRRAGCGGAGRGWWVGEGAGGDPELEPISADSEPAVGAALDAAVAALLGGLPHCPDGDAAALAAPAAGGGLTGVMRAAVAYRLGLKRLLLAAQASEGGGRQRGGSREGGLQAGRVRGGVPARRERAREEWLGQGLLGLVGGCRQWLRRGGDGPGRLGLKGLLGDGRRGGEALIREPQARIRRRWPPPPE